MNKQVNFTTVMDYRQTFTVNLDFEEVKKELMENNGFDDEEVQAHGKMMVACMITHGIQSWRTLISTEIRHGEKETLTMKQFTTIAYYEKVYF